MNITAAEMHHRIRTLRWNKVKLKAECLVAYDATCQYCERQGDQYRGPDGRAWHLDRVYPGALGGRYEPYNVTLTCCACNSRKRHKDPITRPEWDTCLPLAALMFMHRTVSFLEAA